MICWSLWRARNNGVVWQSKSFVANGVVMSAIAYLHQWSRAQSKQKNLVLMWSTGCHHIDASVVGGNDSFGIGWIARDHSGNAVECNSRLILGNVHLSMAEAVGVKEALSWVKQNEKKAVVIESDCQVVVTDICQALHMSSPFGLIVSDCRRLSFFK